VLLGLAAGGFAPVAAYFAGPGSSTYNVALGDVNRDGRVDLVTSDASFNTAGVLLGLAAGGFGPITTYPSGGNAALSVALGDVNGDGRLDIVTINNQPSTAGVLLGQASGGFAPVTTFSVGANAGPSVLLVRDANGDGRPDILMTPEYAFTQIKDTKSVVPIDACATSSKFDKSLYVPATLAEYAAGGVLWSMPFNVSNPVLYYNRKAFTAAGLDPNKPPATLEELQADSKKIVEARASTYGVAFDTGFDSGGGWYTEQWFAKSGDFYADNQNGRSAPATKVNIDDATGVGLMTYLQSMVSSKLAVNVGANDSGQDTLLKMADKTQPAAMSINTSAGLAQVLTILKAGTFPGLTVDDIGIGPMPGPAAQPGVNVGGASLWIVDHKNDAKAAAAWDYIQFLTNAQSQSTWAADTGYVPSRKDSTELDPLKTTYANDPRFAVAFDQLLATPNIPSSAGPALGPQREVRKLVATAMAAILGGADPQTSLTDAAKQSDALIAQYSQQVGG